MSVALFSDMRYESTEVPPEISAMTTTLSDILCSIDSDLLEEDRYFRQVRGENVVLLAHLHCVTSTVDLFKRLLSVDVGLHAKRIILVAKPYSTIKSAITSLRAQGITIIEGEQNFMCGYYDEAASKALKAGCSAARKWCDYLWQKGRKPRLVIIDDGGMVTETWWRRHHYEKFEVISIQQTASGIRRKPLPCKIPKIDVSRSAAKRFFEAKIISAGVLKKVREIKLLENIKTVGVVGIGALGSSLSEDLLKLKLKVYRYDVKRHPDIDDRSNYHLPTLLSHSDIVFGCTGRNFLRLDYLKRLRRERPLHFVSCSSRDVEFMDLLREAPERQGVFGRISIKYEGRQYHIENGGFPINFDRHEEQETADEIALTRGLVLAGVMQALCVDTRRTYNEALMLSPRIQRRLVELWMKLTQRTFDQSGLQEFGLTPEDFTDLHWWERNSFGTLHKVEETTTTHRLTKAELGRRLLAARAI